ncbi:VacB/RNase II family 3'-5' exoribonuclease [Gynuella sp.]|uniref:VacB/RNase II family 3'-5' exoribonuclease n=1 Tax=Gynuella sp. TaxID=2969146 RepID=UPI003D0DF70B
MLDANALAALKQLKSDIRENKQLYTGVVKGSSNRFSFVIRDTDQVEFFLPPQEMDKVLPGDHIEFELAKGEKDREFAVVTKLKHSSMDLFVGRYEVKGQAHLVQPDDLMINKAFFIPPKDRKGNNQDFVACKVTRHPYPDGKAQAKILKVIGNKGSAFIEHEFVKARFGLSSEFSLAISQQTDELDANLIARIKDQRVDETATPFVTIDSAETRDMDDAVWASSNEDGFELKVAIADPTPWFKEDSDIDREAFIRAISTYLPGQTITMLPTKLSHNLCSLVPGYDRLSLVATIKLDHDGHVLGYQFSSAVTHSHAKLNYQEVTDFLEQDKNLGQPENICQSLKTLAMVHQKLNQQRTQQALVMEDRPDYRFNLDDNGKLLSISREDRILAQSIIEECMLLVNRLAADYLNQHNAGLFINQEGIRKEKREEFKQLIQKHCTDVTEVDVDTLQGFIQLAKTLSSQHPYIREISTRLYGRSEISHSCNGHFAQGFNSYTTITSPIRKYVDLFNHRRIQEILSGHPCKAMPAEKLDSLKQSLLNSRGAGQQVEAWLVCSYMENFEGIEFDAEVNYINGIGLGVRLTHNGVDGFVDFRNQKIKSDFNAELMSHTVGGVEIRLGQAVRVELDGINNERKQVQFKCLDLPNA